jgi:alternate signal-mediated exported protein
MKNALSLLILLIACIILVSGFTLAYFTDKSEDNQMHFTTGILKVDIERPTINDSWDNWEPGETKEISWTFRNPGTQPAYVRISFNNRWTKNELPETVLTAVYYSGYEISEDDPEPAVDWVLCSDDWDEEDGYYYYNGAVQPDEEITVNFKATLSNLAPSYLGADYNLSLLLESVQAANNSNPAWD